jgi:KipI family sensor histidine kinase inhibitor
MTQAHIEALGDTALLIRLGDRIDAELNARTLALTAALRSASLPGVIDVAPAYASICVRYDPLAFLGAGALLAAEAFAGASPYDNIRLRLSEIVDNAPIVATPPDALLVEIPVCYGGAVGPDIDAVARHARLTTAEVIARHSAGLYRVAMLGFAPGFPYLLGLDATLHTPRRADPRIRVAAGSVAIGGAQTGIYPGELPGGWQIIGRTPSVLFDAGHEPPALLAPGTQVRFRAIDADEFTALAG